MAKGRGRLVFIAGLGAAGVAAVVLLMRGGGNSFGGEVSEVITSASGAGKSRAQILQELKSKVAKLTTQRDQAEAEITAEYRKRQARETWEGIDARVRSECAGTGWCPFNPWCSCDDQVLADVIAENTAWRTQQLNTRVVAVDGQIAALQAEIESLLLTA